MNILHLNTFDRQGGAAIAAHRIHTGLRKLGINSSMGVLYKITEDPSCFQLENRFSMLLHPFLRNLDKLPLHFYKYSAKSGLFSSMLRPSLVHRKVQQQAPTITHLHWLCLSFFPLFSLARLQGPIVWTTHDCWSFTGGCHFPGNCDHYQEQCGNCPQLGSQAKSDLSHWNWLRKQKIYDRIRPVFVSPSRPFAETARQSSLLRHARIECIPNPVDTEIFRPLPRELARQALNLPLQGRIILFGALSATSDERKGYDLLCKSLQWLPRTGHEDVSCLVFGASAGTQGADIPFPVRFLGHLHDEISLALAYAAADVFVCPSREESFSNTTLEALSCGTPVVAFPVGGIPDMVDHLGNGFLAQPFDTKELAQGIAWAVKDPEQSTRLRQNARQKATRDFSLIQVARQYINLYSELADEFLGNCFVYQNKHAPMGNGTNTVTTAESPAVFEITRIGEKGRITHPLDCVIDSQAYAQCLRATAHHSCNALEKFLSERTVACPEDHRGEAIAKLTMEGRWKGERPTPGAHTPALCEQEYFTQPTPYTLSPSRKLLKFILQRLGLFEMAKRCRARCKRRCGRATLFSGLYCGYGPTDSIPELGLASTTCLPGLVRPTKGSAPNMPKTLAAWVAEGNMATVADNAVFVFDTFPNLEQNVAMLRGLLEPQHRILILNGHDFPLLAGWKKREKQVSGAVMYSDPPCTWLRSRQWLQDGHSWPRFSIVMPSFNQRPFVRQALESVFSQQYPNLETIVLDAGSTDGTRDILLEYAPKITRLILEPDKGQSDALQRGLNLTTGKYITWLNTDDLLEPDALFRAVETFELFKVDMVSGGCRVVDEENKELIRHFPALPFEVPIRLDASRLMNYFGSWTLGDFFYQPEVFFTRDLWLRSGAFFHAESYYAMDYDLWVRMALAGAVGIQLPNFLACSRHQRNQKTNLENTDAPFLWQALNFLRHYEKLLDMIISS